MLLHISMMLLVIPMQSLEKGGKFYLTHKVQTNIVRFPNAVDINLNHPHLYGNKFSSIHWNGYIVTLTKFASQFPVQPVRKSSLNYVFKPKYHFHKIFANGCTGSCQNDNLQCSQWLKFHQNDDISVYHYSVYPESYAHCLRFVRLCCCWISIDFNSLGTGRCGSNSKNVISERMLRITACCLMEPNHYLNQCWLIISKVHRKSSEVGFTRDTSAINH